MSPSPLVLVGRPGCHLCDEMRAVVLAVAGPLGLALQEVDVADDPELERRYIFEIPVLMRDGRELARHRVDEATLRALLGPGPA